MGFVDEGFVGSGGAPASGADHGSLSGLGDNDHPQYRLAATPIDHGALTGLADDDHPQYALADGSRGAFGAELVYERTVTAADIQDLAIPGLEGDDHGAYFIELRAIVPPSTAQTYEIRPNGLTTNLERKMSTDYGAPAAASTGVITAAINVAGPVELIIRAYVVAGKSLNGVASWRKWEIDSTVYFNAAGFMVNYKTHVAWKETATELNSLNFFSSAAGGFKIGTQLLVWRARTSFDA